MAKAVTQILDRLFPVLLHHRGRNTQAQELFEYARSSGHRLPEYGALHRFPEPRRRRRRQCAAHANSNYAPDGIAFVCAPFFCVTDIGHPPVPSRLFELAVTVAGTIEVDRGGRQARLCKSTRRLRHHAPTLVQLLGKGGNEEHTPAGPSRRRRMQQGKDAVAGTAEELRPQRARIIHAPAFADTNWTSEPTVAKVSADTSSSSTDTPNSSSIKVSTVTTAIESSSGMLPRSGLDSVNRSALSPNCRAS